MIRHKNIWPDKPVMMQLPEIYKGFMNLRLVEPSAAIFGANRQEDQRGYPLRFEDSSRWSVSLWKFHKITFQYKVIRLASRLIFLFPANSGSDEPRPTEGVRRFRVRMNLALPMVFGVSACGR